MHFLLYAPVLFLIGTHVRATSFVTDEEKWQKFEVRLREYEQKIDRLQTMNDIHQNSIARLDRLCKVPHTNESDSKLKQGSRDSKYKSLDIVRNNDQFNHELHNGSRLRRPSGASDEHIDLSRRQAESPVGFFAFLDHSVTLSRGQKIIFNKVTTNEGNGYSIGTGTFTCPVSGMYIFSFTVTIRGHHQVWADLRINGAAKAEGVADGYHDHADMQGGNTGVFNLKVGDYVYVNSLSDDTYHADATDGGILNTFTGALLYRY